MACKGTYQKGYALLSLLICLGLAGCQEQEIIDKEVELQAQTTGGSAYELTQVTRGKVEQVMYIQCTFTQTEEIDLCFEIDQELITEVLVEKGDSVVKGELLASVNVDAMVQKAEELRHQLAKNELKLQQLIEKRDFELEQARIWYEGYTSMTKADKESMEQEVEKITESYEKNIRDYEDTVYFQRQRLQEYDEYIENGQLTAPMDGMISYVRSGLEGTITEKGECVIRIYDPASKMYYSENVEAIPYLQADTEYTIACGLGSGMREYTVMPVNMESWGERVYFRLLDEDYDPNNVIRGKITLVLEEKDDALNVNNDAIHSSGDEYYVYTLDENNVRRMQFVEVGLWGDETVEILSGLSEGDRVILR